jgi:hypothetical protein
MGEITETPDSDNPVFTVFRNTAQSVEHFPPNIIAETRVNISQLLAEMEAKALCEQTRPRASVFPCHNYSSSFDYQVLCYPVTGTSRQLPVCQLLKRCPLQAQQLIHEVTSASEPTQTPTPPQTGNEGGSNEGDEFDPDTSGFADAFKFG